MCEYICRQLCRKPKLLALLLALSSDHMAVALLSLITPHVIEIVKWPHIVLSMAMRTIADLHRWKNAVVFTDRGRIQRCLWMRLSRVIM
jgi:hypothetical protein